MGRDAQAWWRTRRSSSAVAGSYPVGRHHPHRHAPEQSVQLYLRGARMGRIPRKPWIELLHPRDRYLPAPVRHDGVALDVRRSRRWFDHVLDRSGAGFDVRVPDRRIAGGIAQLRTSSAALRHGPRFGRELKRPARVELDHDRSYVLWHGAELERALHPHDIPVTVELAAAFADAANVGEHD